MKNFYAKIFSLSLLFILQLYCPARLVAQCTCAGGVPAAAIKQVVSMPMTNTSSLSFTFQKFDPTIGTLWCTKMYDTISGISSSYALNSSPTDSSVFLFYLSLFSKVTGPGILQNHTFNKTYGYDTLAPYGVPGYNITYGPDAIFTNYTQSASPGANAGFIGAGTVDLLYTLSGGLVVADGPANDTTSISTIIGGSMGLTYYYCPLSLLASGLQNFTAHKTNNNIALKWDAQNATDIDRYDIEYSLDGVSFTGVAAIEGTHSASASTYNYNYVLNGNSSGYVYFRIKQTSNTGKTGYSAIEKISLDEKSSLGISIHPNPVTTGMSIAFDHPLNGDYSVDILNMSGQVIINKKLKMANSNIIPINWSIKPVPGMYITRITNTGTMEQQIIRVVVQ